MNALAASPPPTPSASCLVCGTDDALVPATLVRPAVAALIQSEHADWSDANAICTADLHRYRMARVRKLLEEERGTLDEGEHAVLDSIAHQTPLAEDTTEEQLTVGERLSDRIASFGGSWTFISIFGATIVCWMIVNTVLLATQPFDPYPFILLNLVLSCLAAVQAPIIMMSQNRQEAHDRTQAENDYRINLKAELEIRQLHEKIDHLVLRQGQRLMEMQAVQTELLDELNTRK